MILRAQRGQATVELALLLPILAILGVILVEIGSLATDNVRVWHAAREAARVGSVDSDPGAIRAAAMHSGLDPISINVEPVMEARVQGEPLTVRVTYRPSSRVPMIGRLLSGVVMQARATMRIEQP